MRKSLCCLFNAFLAVIYSYITVDLKQRALQLIDLRRFANKIAPILGVSAKSIGWWEGARAQLRNPRHRYRQSDISPLLPPKTTWRSWRSSVSLSEKLHHFISMTSVNGGLSCTTQVFPFHSCIIYNLQGMALTCRVMGRVAAEHDNAHQDEWILNVMNNYTPEQRLFLDKQERTITQA